MQSEVKALIGELDSYQVRLYPSESNHLLDLATLPESSLILLKIMLRDQQAVGCGAVVLNGDGSGEIKRVYIDSQHRGQHLGEKLIAALEEKARESGCSVLRLETGIKQPAAIKLYQRCGYQRCAAFAPYTDDPLSIYMEKVLLRITI